jgi:hypothetical protein
MKNTVVSITALLAASYSCFGADFVNLDFESGTVVRTENCCAIEYQAGPSVPGWTFGSQSTIFDASEFFNRGRIPEVYLATPYSVSVNSASVLSGNYSLYLPNYNSDGIRPDSSITLSQVGTVPTDAVSLTFFGLIGLSTEPPVGTFTVSFAGNALSIVELSNEGAYKVYGADISPYSGQTGELKFELTTGYWGSYATLDQIAFSTVAVPEPSALSIIGCTMAALGGFAARRRLLTKQCRG